MKQAEQQEAQKLRTRVVYGPGFTVGDAMLTPRTQNCSGSFSAGSVYFLRRSYCVFLK